jgi:small-conductance mechanosensitive channel
MNDEKIALTLLQDLWGDLHESWIVWQLLALLLSLGIAWLLARKWQRSPLAAAQPGLRAAGARLVFPLTAVLLVLMARGVMHHYMHVHLLSVAIPLLTSLAIVRGVLHMLRRSFPGAAWLAASERYLAGFVWMWLALYITGVAPIFIDALEQVSFAVGKQNINLWMILNGVVVIFLTVLASLWLASLLETRLLAARQLDASLRMVLVRLLKALLAIFAILTSLALVGIDITALSVFTGALGVGLGFGLQKIASNYVSGFIMLLDRSIRIGNVVMLDATTSGTVSQITTRYTVLRHAGGTEFIVPNETMVGSIVQNQSFSDSQVRVATKVSVAYSSDLDQVVALLAEIAAAHPRVLSDPPPRALVMAFADSGIDLELGFWIIDPEAGFGNVRSDVNLEIWRRFRAAGIEIPFPQREVRLLGAAADGA